MKVYSTWGKLPTTLSLALLATSWLLVGPGCSPNPTPTSEPTLETGTSQSGGGSRPSAEQMAMVNEVRPKVEAFCSDCHALPRPSSSPRDEWEMEIIQGFDLYRESGRTDLAVPNQRDVERYFKFQAPETLGMPLPETLNYPGAADTHAKRGVLRERVRPAGVTNVNYVDLKLPSMPGKVLVYCDIGTGTVNAYHPGQSASQIQRLATLLQPVHSDACDLDQDGLVDLLVADIGEFNAADSDLGRVVWLRRQADSESFQSHVILEGLSRTADARGGDFDGDGDTDVLVATFGWRHSGRTLLLVNEGTDDQGMPRFTEKTIDQRHGPVHLEPVDFDDDGDLDFVSLISQEHERVELFRNDGGGNFKNELIWAAPDPAYGSSGIELVDMDLDGDLDILYTNGDSFDRGPKPHHSVQWLENDGVFPMKRHAICRMPGVLNATAADFDSDGDIDVVAVALLAADISRDWVAQGSSPIVLLTQQDDGQFTPARLPGRGHDHLSVEKGDFNGDGKPDFAIGNFFRGVTGPEILKEPELLIWESK